MTWLMMLLTACDGSAEPTAPTPESELGVLAPASGWTSRFDRFLDDPFDGTTGGFSTGFLDALRTSDAWELAYYYQFTDGGNLPVVVFEFARHRDGETALEVAPVPLDRDAPTIGVAIGSLEGESTPAYAHLHYGGLRLHHGQQINVFAGGSGGYTGLGFRGEQAFGQARNTVLVFHLRTWRNLTHVVPMSAASLCPSFLDDGSLAVLGRNTLNGDIQLWRPGTERNLVYSPPNTGKVMESVARVADPLPPSDAPWRCHATGVAGQVHGAFSNGSVLVPLHLGVDGVIEVDPPVQLEGLAVDGILPDGRVVGHGADWVALIDGGISPIGARPLVAAGSRVTAVKVSRSSVAAVLTTNLGVDGALITLVTPEVLP
jgi:hypothetical protein